MIVHRKEAGLRQQTRPSRLSAGAFGSWRAGDDALADIEAHQSELKLGLAQKHAALAAAAAKAAAAVKAGPGAGARSPRSGSSKSGGCSQSWAWCRSTQPSQRQQQKRRLQLGLAQKHTALAAAAANQQLQPLQQQLQVGCLRPEDANAACAQKAGSAFWKRSERSMLPLRRSGSTACTDSRAGCSCIGSSSSSSSSSSSRCTCSQALYVLLQLECTSSTCTKAGSSCNSEGAAGAPVAFLRFLCSYNLKAQLAQVQKQVAPALEAAAAAGAPVVFLRFLCSYNLKAQLAFVQKQAAPATAKAQQAQLALVQKQVAPALEAAAAAAAAADAHIAFITGICGFTSMLVSGACTNDIKSNRILAASTWAIRPQKFIGPHAKICGAVSQLHFYSQPSQICTSRGPDTVRPATTTATTAVTTSALDTHAAPAPATLPSPGLAPAPRMGATAIAHTDPRAAAGDAAPAPKWCLRHAHTTYANEADEGLCGPDISAAKAKGPKCSSECLGSLLVILQVILGCTEGPWCLSDFHRTDRCTKAGRPNQAPIGHLRARCLSWPLHGVVIVNIDTAGCRDGRQGGAAGLRKVAGAYYSQVFACGHTSEGAQREIHCSEYAKACVCAHVSIVADEIHCSESSLMASQVHLQRVRQRPFLLAIGNGYKYVCCESNEGQRWCQVEIAVSQAKANAIGHWRCLHKCVCCESNESQCCCQVEIAGEPTIRYTCLNAQCVSHAEACVYAMYRLLQCQIIATYFCNCTHAPYMHANPGVFEDMWMVAEEEEKEAAEEEMEEESEAGALPESKKAEEAAVAAAKEEPSLAQPPDADGVDGLLASDSQMATSKAQQHVGPEGDAVHKCKRKRKACRPGASPVVLFPEGTTRAQQAQGKARLAAGTTKAADKQHEWAVSHTLGSDITPQGALEEVCTCTVMCIVGRNQRWRVAALQHQST
ncbi:hypothetical protein DUNSADRAFT_10371 [Dunaliella salina]|uniref:Uncharacterized protein n=1 Tax=Dunaliella salina TaxID=3046 RepID=A0ABQ7GFI2_DUNSA|nr:hypothetical protein DUNSADRAFT_10371 [Dunaliella salina]|eukprot:KAF5833368.1 hypothetical protein DUNSADRAFT_10371 [Dunaliella salina]